jgi:hypothetical protein
MSAVHLHFAIMAWGLNVENMLIELVVIPYSSIGKELSKINHVQHQHTSQICPHVQQ